MHPLLLALGFFAARFDPRTVVSSFSELQYPVDVAYLDVAGTRIAYADEGHGEPLVLLHGLGGYIPSWTKNLEALAEHHRVIAVDLPGFGKSDKPAVPYTMSYFAEVVHELVQRLGLVRPVVIGHSMGGQIAIHYALRHPDRVRALVLSSPAGLETFSPTEAAWLRGAVTPAFTYYASDEVVHARHAANFATLPGDAAFLVDDRIAIKHAREFEAYCQAISSCVAGMLAEPVHAQLPELAPPTLVLFGDRDGLIPNPFLHHGRTGTLAQREVDRIPNARLHLLERAGHLAQFEAASAWNAAVVDFLGALPPPAASASD